MIHYQFEAIHCYHDGNGRTGRILNILYLVHAGLLKLPVLYQSRYIIEHKSEYYALLRGVTEQHAWEPWVLFMLKATEQTARWTTERIVTIRDLFTRTCERAREELPASMYSKELMELLFVQPYTKIQFLVDSGLAGRQTASKYLRALEEAGIV